MTNELKPSDERIIQLILMLDAPGANIGRKSAEELQILLQELLNVRTSGMVLVEKPYRIVTSKLPWPGKKTQFGIMLRYKDQKAYSQTLKALQGKE